MGEMQSITIGLKNFVYLTFFEIIVNNFKVSNENMKFMCVVIFDFLGQLLFPSLHIGLTSLAFGFITLGSCKLLINLMLVNTIQQDKRQKYGDEKAIVNIVASASIFVDI